MSVESQLDITGCFWKNNVEGFFLEADRSNIQCKI